MNNISNVNGSNKTKRITSFSLALILILISAAACLGMAIVPRSLRRMDLTAGKLFTLSEESKKFLGALDEQVEVTVLAPDGTQTNFEIFMEEYEKSSDKLSVKEVYLTEDVSAELGISADAVTPYSLIVKSEKRETMIDFLSLFTYSNKELGFTDLSASNYNYYLQMYTYYAQQDAQYLTYLNSLYYNTEMYFVGDAQLTAAIEYVTADIIYTSYLLTGHGENDFSKTLLSNVSAVYPTLDLSKEGSVPADAAAIIINTPAEDISADEAAMLIEYLSEGGQITLLTNDENLGMPNLCSVLAAYGLSAEKGTVGIDVEVTLEPEDTGETEDTEGESADTEESEEAEEAVTNIVKQNTVTPNVNSDHSVMSYVLEDEYKLAITNGNSIEFTKTDDPSLLHTALLTTTEDAYVGENKNTIGIHTLAAAAETADGARLVWFTGAGSFNTALQTVEGVSNCYAVIYAMSWVERVYSSSLGSIPSKLYETLPLQIDDSTVNIMSIVTVFVLPIAIIAVGAFIIYLRTKVKKAPSEEQ